MSRHAETAFLGAVERYPDWRQEDRLTEVFACALHLLPELAGWFVQRAGGPAPMQHEVISVTTQNSLAGAGRPDMFVDYGGHRILSEHKIDATATAYQGFGYPDWKDVHSVLIARDVAPYRETTPFDAYLSWAEVADEVKRIGSERGGDAWRQLAVDPDQPSRLRCCEELLCFLERHNVGVVNETPIDDESVQHYRGFEAARLQLKRFFTLLWDDAEIQALMPGAIAPERMDRQWWFSLEVPWPYLSNLYPEECDAQIALQPDADWLEERNDEPVLYAGYWFSTPDGRLHERLTGVDTPTYRALRPGVRQIGQHGRKREQGKYADILYLSDILAYGTLPEQARYAAHWAADAIQEISRIS